MSNQQQNNQSKWVPVSSKDILFSILGYAKPEQLAQMIEEDKYIQLPSIMKPVIARAVADFIIEFLKNTRPDLAQLLQSEKGKKWLSNQILVIFR